MKLLVMASLLAMSVSGSAVAQNARPGPLRIIVDTGNCSTGNVRGRIAMRAAEAEVRALRRKAYAEGREVIEIERIGGMQLGTLRTSEGLLSDIPVIRPTC